MILTKPSIEFLDSNSKGLALIEQAGRTCYQSQPTIPGSTGSATKFTQMLLDKGHHAMIEFGWLCYRIICDRGVTHELVRHRLVSWAQESTRWCNYKGGVTFIIPPWVDIPERFIDTDTWFDNEENYLDAADRTGDIEYFEHENLIWLRAMQEAEEHYQHLMGYGSTPQKARSVLPNSLKTQICMAANIREWRHFFLLRTHKDAHPQMREVANMLLVDARERYPVVFDDLIHNV